MDACAEMNQLMGELLPMWDERDEAAFAALLRPYTEAAALVWDDHMELFRMDVDGGSCWFAELPPRPWSCSPLVRELAMLL